MSNFFENVKFFTWGFVIASFGVLILAAAYYLVLTAQPAQAQFCVEPTDTNVENVAPMWGFEERERRGVKL